MRFASLLFGGFITDIVVNSPERKHFYVLKKFGDSKMFAKICDLTSPIMYSEKNYLLQTISEVSKFLQNLKCKKLQNTGILLP